MDALLILGGLLLILAGLIWLVVLAFGTGLLWGVGSLLPPVTLVYVARHWMVARKAVGLSGLGVIPLVVGFTLLANHEPERVAAIASLEWLEPDEQTQSQQLSFRLHGELDGRSFSPQFGSYVDGVLTLREGDQLFARQEVSIRLGAKPSGAIQVDVLPQDVDPAPVVEINWMRPEQELPEARRIQSGYTLHLNLQPAPPNKLVGDFHLVLPAHYQTSLSGQVELFTDNLRYRAGRVDLTHDSVDTLAYVAGDYLQRRFETRDVTIESVAPVNLPASSLVLSISAKIEGTAQLFDLAISKGDQGWAVEDDTFPP
ncbi:MAG TPA: MFS transporter, partial [Pseudomonas sp.]|nr:MFS transporter [Pseudomonas sp.]